MLLRIEVGNQRLKVLFWNGILKVFNRNHRLLKHGIENWRSRVEPVVLLLLSHLELLLEYLFISCLSFLFSSKVFSSLYLSMLHLSLNLFCFVHLVLFILNLLLVLLTGQIKVHFVFALDAVHLLTVLAESICVSRLNGDLVRLASLFIWTIKILLSI